MQNGISEARGRIQSLSVILIQNQRKNIIRKELEVVFMCDPIVLFIVHQRQHDEAFTSFPCASSHRHDPAPPPVPNTEPRRIHPLGVLLNSSNDGFRKEGNASILSPFEVHHHPPLGPYGSSPRSKEDGASREKEYKGRARGFACFAPLPQGVMVARSGCCCCCGL